MHHNYPFSPASLPESCGKKDIKAALSVYSVARFDNRTYSAEIPCLNGQPPPASSHICAVRAFALFYHTAFGIKLQVNFGLFQNFVDFVRFPSPSGAFMTILTRENAVFSPLEGYALEQV